MEPLSNKKNVSSELSSSIAERQVNEPEPEVTVKKKRKYHTASYKLRILEELDACTEPGQKGVIMRREGLYSSRISAWRQAKETGALSALNKKRGRKLTITPEAKRITDLEQENAKLKKQLEQAENIIDIQKKVSAMFGSSVYGTAASEVKL